MVKLIELLIKEINRYTDEIEKNSEMETQIFIEDIYLKAEEICTNYLEILQCAYNDLIDNNKSIDDILRFLNDNRLPFKSVRAKARGFVKHPYYQRKRMNSGFR